MTETSTPSGAIVSVCYDASGGRLATIHAGESGVVKIWERRDTSSWALISAWEVDGALTSVDWAGEDVSSGLLATAGEKGGIIWERCCHTDDEGGGEGQVAFGAVERLGTENAKEIKFGKGAIVGVGGIDGIVRIWRKSWGRVWRPMGVIGETGGPGGGLCWGKGVGAKGMLVMWGGGLWMGSLGGVKWERVVALEGNTEDEDGADITDIVSADWTAMAMPLTWVIAVARGSGVVEIYCVDPTVEWGMVGKKEAVIKMAILDDVKHCKVTKLEFNRTAGFLLAAACEDGECRVWQPREDSLEEWNLVKSISAGA